MTDCGTTVHKWYRFGNEKELLEMADVPVPSFFMMSPTRFPTIHFNHKWGVMELSLMPVFYCLVCIKISRLLAIQKLIFQCNRVAW